MKPINGLLALSATVALPAVPAITAQEVLNWADFELCNDCEFAMAEEVRLGDRDGPGIVEADHMRAAWNGELGFLLFPLGGTGIKIFGHDGTFEREIGKEGEGPGEFRSIWDLDVIDERIVVLEGGRKTVVMLSHAGDYITQHRFHHPEGGQVTPVGQGRLVMFATTWRTRVIEHPLHLIDLSSGATTLQFGAANAGAEVTDILFNTGKRVAGSVVSRPGTVWWGWNATADVQEWSAEGEFLRYVEGELPWFPEITEMPDLSREPPATLLTGLALDADDNLWVTLRTADPAWDDVPLERLRVGYAVPEGREDEYYDTRLDVFSLRERRHLGRYVWDSADGRLLDRGGEPAVYVPEYDNAMVPQVVVYRAGSRGGL